MSDYHDLRQSLLRSQVRFIEELAGKTIRSARAVEEALWDISDGQPPVFQHDKFPFLQLWGLYLELDDGRLLLVTWYQNDDNFGLLIEPCQDYTEFPAEWNRTRPLEALAGHKIIDATVSFDDVGDITRIRFSFSSRPDVTLVAGEVYENMDGSVIVRTQDESILLFWDPDALDNFPFDRKIFL